MSNFLVTLKYMPDPNLKSVLILVSIKNISDKEIYLLDWFTPLEGLISDMFVVTVMNKEKTVIPYSGIMVRRSKPRDELYELISPDEVKISEIDLLDGYSLPFGRYKVQFRSNFNYKQDGMLYLKEVVSETIEILF